MEEERLAAFLEEQPPLVASVFSLYERKVSHTKLNRFSNRSRYSSSADVAVPTTLQCVCSNSKKRIDRPLYS